MNGMTQETIANRINVTSRTVRNWEQDKPELLRLLRIAIESENYHLDFWNLFGNVKSFTLLDNFYIDFYFKFLNYFRKNITMYSVNDDRSSTDIVKTLIIYLIQHDISQLFDSKFIIDGESLRTFERDELARPLLLNCNEDLSEYILRNTIDDFETLVNDSYSSDNRFVEAIKISLFYMIYKYDPDLSFVEKQVIYRELTTKIGVGRSSLKNISKINKKVIYSTYIEEKDKFCIEYLNLLDDEPDYRSNSFYIPVMIKRMESCI